MPKCELCTQPSMPNDILCYVCSLTFDPNPPPAEVYGWERTLAAANWICETYGPVFAARFGVDDE